MKKMVVKSVGVALATGLVALSLQAQPPVVSQLKLQALPPGITEARIRTHVIAPQRLQNIEIVEPDERKYARLAIPRRVVKFNKKPHVNLGAFGTAVHTILKNQTSGYILQVRKNGQLAGNWIWNWAQTPADQGKGWSQDTRMHVASVSKFLTAVAMVKALDSKGISYDAKIVNYLPSYWAKGSKINQITFRHLLTQTSGFNTDSSKSDYEFMKGKVAAGVPAVGSYDYENMNFGLCRILIPIVMGNIDKDAKFFEIASINDQCWDAVTLLHFKNYMQANVFSRAGVPNVGFEPIPNMKNALAYKFPAAGKGWNSGDLGSMAGGAGFRLSTKELLNVMDHIRRRGTIISPAKAQYMMDNRFGLDQIMDTPAGKLYNKNGGWRSDGRKEQCIAYFLPDGMELAIFVNSPVGSQDYFLRSIINDCYMNAMQE